MEWAEEEIRQDFKQEWKPKKRGQDLVGKIKDAVEILPGMSRTQIYNLHKFN